MNSDSLHLETGPTKDLFMDYLLGQCVKNWWTIPAMIGNFYQMHEQCLCHLWWVLRYHVNQATGNPPVVGQDSIGKQVDRKVAPSVQGTSVLISNS